MEREAVLLVIADGQKVHEAAAMSGVSVSAMKMRLSRARSRLIQLMDGQP
jgi:DNA-directed RNA polymerase specialized sigma24 family protein